MQDCNCYQLCLEGKFARCPALKYGSLMRVAVFSWFPLIAVNTGLSWNILMPFRLLPSVVAFRPFCTDVVTPRTSCRPSNRHTRAHKTYIIIWDHMRIITSYTKCIYNNCTYIDVFYRTVVDWNSKFMKDSFFLEATLTPCKPQSAGSMWVKDMAPTMNSPSWSTLVQAESQKV